MSAAPPSAPHAAAEKLYALHDGEQAATVAQQVLALQPPATPTQRRTAWTVLAHTAFERADFGQAERAYVEVLALLPPQDAARNAMVERLLESGDLEARLHLAHPDRNLLQP